MLNLFREAYTSFQNNRHGGAIIEKTLGSVIWYWSRYFLIVVGISLLLGIFFFTNQLPQIPKFIESNLPEGRFELKDGTFFTTVSQPFISGDSDFSLVVDTTASASALNPYLTGILISQNDITFKAQDGTLTTQSFKNFPSFASSRSELSSLISENFIKVWLILFIIAIAFSIIIGSIFWFQKIFSYVIWSAIFYLIIRLFQKKRLAYINVLKLVIYASVLPLILSVIFSSTPGPLFDIISLVITAYFTFNWIGNLPAPSMQTFPPTTSSPKRKSSRKPR